MTIRKDRIVFVTGATGYLGRAAIPRLLARGHAVRALVRPGSEKKLPGGCLPVHGDALHAASYAQAIPPARTLVHLVGTPRPAPWKGRQFRAVDGASLDAALDAAHAADIEHFVYVSVAQPAPVMRAYVAVRAECEAHIRAAGIAATILRPWYVLGPGHRWPHVLRPAYWLAERLPATAAGARRLGLLRLDQMVAALVWAVENPSAGVRVLEVPELRQLRAQAAAPSWLT
jgi:uncharacterized protein YbjT (DUF2867 family)